MNNNRSIFCAVLSIIFAFFAIASPLLIIFFVIAFAVSYTLSITYSKVSLILAPLFVLSQIIIGASYYYCLIPFVVVCGCIVASVLIKQKLNMQSVVIATGSAISLLSLLAGGAVVYFKTGALSYEMVVNVLRPFKVPFQQSLNQLFEAYSKAGVKLENITAENIYNTIATAVTGVFIPLLPGIIVGFSIILSFAVLYFVKKFLYKTNIENSLGLASDFQLSKISVWVYLLAMILQLTLTNSIIGIAVLNFNFVISSLFFLTGISVIAFMLNFNKAKFYIKLIVFIVIFIISMLGFFEFISFIGVFATIFNVRERYSALPPKKL